MTDTVNIENLADTDNLTEEELETAVQEELDNEKSPSTDINVETEEEVVETSEEEDKPKNKTEDRFKKILSEKNKAKTKNTELEDRINQLEKENADEKFYNSNPNAKEHQDNIEELMKENPNLDRRQAYILSV